MEDGGVCPFWCLIPQHSTWMEGTKLQNSRSLLSFNLRTTSIVLQYICAWVEPFCSSRFALLTTCLFLSLFHLHEFVKLIFTRSPSYYINLGMETAERQTSSNPKPPCLHSNFLFDMFGIFISKIIKARAWRHTTFPRWWWCLSLFFFFFRSILFIAF